MNRIEEDYLELLEDILRFGVEKKDRTGTGTKSVFGRQLRHKMRTGFPLLTTKKMAFKTMVTELLWFLRGDTSIEYLLKNDCHIWDGDAYKNYLHKVISDKDIVRYLKSYSIDTKGVPTIEPYSKDEFIERIKTDKMFAFRWGDLGPIYGKQWRRWEGREWMHDNQSRIDFLGTVYTDQIANLINDLKTNPDSRRLMVSAWNVGELDQMVLPPCHYGFQVYTRELTLQERMDEYKRRNLTPNIDPLDLIPTRSISLMWNQRSVDTALGLPFNISSYALLLMMIAKQVDMVPDELICNLGDCHIYLNQIEGVKEQIDRKPYDLPRLKLSDRKVNDISEYTLEDITLENYQYHPTIKMPLSN